MCYGEGILVGQNKRIHDDDDDDDIHFARVTQLAHAHNHSSPGPYTTSSSFFSLRLYT